MPLTEGQRKFLNQNIAKGGEIIVFDVVQNKSTRIKEARQRDLCIRCAGPGHFASECKATRQSSSGTAVIVSKLNAILPGTGNCTFK